MTSSLAWTSRPTPHLCPTVPATTTNELAGTYLCYPNSLSRVSGLVLHLIVPAVTITPSDPLASRRGASIRRRRRPERVRGPKLSGDRSDVTVVCMQCVAQSTPMVATGLAVLRRRSMPTSTSTHPIGPRTVRSSPNSKHGERRTRSSKPASTPPASRRSCKPSQHGQR